MAKALSQESIHLLKKELAKVKGVPLSNCIFKLSKKGNVVCHYNGKVIYTILKNGLLQPTGVLKIDETKIYLPPLLSEQEVKMKGLDVIHTIKEGIENPIVRSSKYITGYEVVRENKNCVSIKPRTYCLYIQSFEKSYMEIHKNWTEQELVKRAKSLVGQRHNITLSATFQQMLLSQLVVKYRSEETLCVPESLQVLFKESDFLKWCMKKKNLGAPGKGQLEGNKICFTFGNKSMAYDLEKRTISMRSEKAFLDTVSFVKRNDKKMEAILKQLKENAPWKLKISKNQISGTMTVDQEQITFTQAEAELSARELQKMATACRKRQEQERKKREEALLAKAKSNKFYGDIAAIQIVKCVITNQKYITENVVIKNLRDLRSTVVVEPVEGTKKFSLVSNEYLSERIRSLVKSGILYEKEVTGTYGEFAVLKPDESAQYFISYAQRRVKRWKNFTEMDWFYYLQNHSIDEDDPEQLALMEQKGLVCMYPELVKPYLMRKPEFWKEYAGVMYSAEKGTEKKYWKVVKSMFEK